MILKVLLIAHFLADFTLQSTRLAGEKRNSQGKLLLHCGIYAFVMALACFFCVRARSAIVPALLLGALHLAIDEIKFLIGRLSDGAADGLLVFLGDQMLHLAVIVLIWQAFWLDGVPSAVWRTLLEWEKLHSLLLALLILVINWDPACVLVRKIFDEMSAGREPSPFADEPKAGRIIGKLERLIISVLVLAGQPGAIGFVLTAKSIARFKQFDDQGFAERYLVGTLASTAIAIITALALWKLG